LKILITESTEIRLGEIEVAGGGNYILSIAKNHTNIDSAALHNHPYALGLHTITKPNSIHMLWLLPQYVIITVGEIMFSITGLEFSYSQVKVLQGAVQAI
jgi:solute carrier family 15 oligopeptide transporter 1